MLVSPCNLHNGLRHCRGKQQGLTLVWNIAQDGFYILAESHVKHLIRLIKRHNLHIIKFHGLPAHMIHHAPRRTNYNLCPRLEEMTPIQAQAIPVVLSGKDIIGQAQTGTGKTAAFGLPVLQNIDPKKKTLQAVILCPTRELAIQVSEEMRCGIVAENSRV